MEELLCDNINSEGVNIYNYMILYLQNISETSRTEKLWVKNVYGLCFNDAVCEKVIGFTLISSLRYFALFVWSKSPLCKILSLLSP